MAETREEQSSFGWIAEGTTSPATTPAGAPPQSTPATPKAPAPGRASRARAARASASEAPLPPDNELWDVHAAARFLKRSVSWVYHRTEDGTLPVRRLGGWGIRFVPRELRAWVEGAADPGRSE